MDNEPILKPTSFLLPENTHNKLKVLAAQRRITMRNLITEIIEKAAKEMNK